MPPADKPDDRYHDQRLGHYLYDAWHEEMGITRYKPWEQKDEKSKLIWAKVARRLVVNFRTI